MNNISVLCFNKDDELVFGSVPGKVEDGYHTTVEGKHYQVINAQSKTRGVSGCSTRVVDFVKWKEDKNKKE